MRAGLAVAVKVALASASSLAIIGSSRRLRASPNTYSTRFSSHQLISSSRAKPLKRSRVVKLWVLSNGGAVTSNAGATLLREADRGIGLTAKGAGCFRDGRAAELVVHNIETLVAQRVHAIALGYEDINDHDELRHDPVLGLLSDTLEPKRADVATLAGKSTLNRLEHGLKSGVSRYHKIS